MVPHSGAKGNFLINWLFGSWPFGLVSKRYFGCNSLPSIVKMTSQNCLWSLVLRHFCVLLNCVIMEIKQILNYSHYILTDKSSYPRLKKNWRWSYKEFFLVILQSSFFLLQIWPFTGLYWNDLCCVKLLQNTFSVLKDLIAKKIRISVS